MKHVIIFATLMWIYVDEIQARLVPTSTNTTTNRYEQITLLRYFVVAAVINAIITLCITKGMYLYTQYMHHRNTRITRERTLQEERALYHTLSYQLTHKEVR